LTSPHPPYHITPDRVSEKRGTVVISKPAYDEVDLSSMAFWSRTADERELSFSVLRRERPVSWHRPLENPLLPVGGPDAGYWAVVCHEDVVAVSKDPQTFCSGQGVMYGDAPPEMLEASQSFLAMDAPRHGKLRRLVASAFTPRRVALIDEQIRAQARAIVDDLLPLGECDVVEHISRRLPMLTISEMMGVAPADSDRFADLANRLVGAGDPDVIGDGNPLELMFECLVGLTTMALGLAADRRARPADDLMTALVQAEVEGDRLTDEEIGAFFVLLNVAGNDTTRHTISHGLRALTRFPDQRRLLMDDFGNRIDGAIDEMLRWSTPVMNFRRTATRDVELRGSAIAEGEKVVLFYSSANRDERVFEDPERFDILRHPNPHVGFGGGGPHFCLGFSLARAELRAIFDEMVHRVPDIAAGEPEYLGGNFMNGIKRLPVRFTPTGSWAHCG
jgi:cytochrome P450